MDAAGTKLTESPCPLKTLSSMKVGGA